MNSYNNVSINSTNITYSSNLNSYFCCKQPIANKYKTLHISVLVSSVNINSSYTWAACRAGVRPTYGSDGSSNYNNYYIPSDWYKMGYISKYGDSKDTEYRDFQLDVTEIDAESYYFFVHTAGNRWTINKIWFE